jgi:hypothetical protein
MTEKADRKKALEWAEEHLIDKSVYNSALGAEILFTRQGIKHAISSRIYSRKITLLYDLPDLIATASLIDITADKKGRAEIKKVYRLFSEWKNEGKTYQVFIVVRLMANGYVYYDHEIVKEKNLN